MASPLDAQVQPEGDGARIILTGRIDREGDAEMVSAYAKARTTGAGPIVLDFSATGTSTAPVSRSSSATAEARRDGGLPRAAL